MAAPPCFVQCAAASDRMGARDGVEAAHLRAGPPLPPRCRRRASWSQGRGGRRLGEVAQCGRVGLLVAASPVSLPFRCGWAWQGSEANNFVN